MPSLIYGSVIPRFFHNSDSTVGLSLGLLSKREASGNPKASASCSRTLPTRTASRMVRSQYSESVDLHPQSRSRF